MVSTSAEPASVVGGCPGQWRECLVQFLAGERVDTIGREHPLKCVMGAGPCFGKGNMAGWKDWGEVGEPLGVTVLA